MICTINHHVGLATTLGLAEPKSVGVAHSSIRWDRSVRVGWRWATHTPPAPAWAASWCKLLSLLSASFVHMVRTAVKLEALCEPVSGKRQLPARVVPVNGWLDDMPYTNQAACLATDSDRLTWKTRAGHTA